MEQVSHSITIEDIQNCIDTVKKEKWRIGERLVSVKTYTERIESMALEAIKGVETIGGYDVVVMDELREKYPEKFNESGAMDYKWFEKEIRPTNHIYVRHDVNSLSFTIQNGPIKENGVNGCQVDTIIEAAKVIIEGLNTKFPCRENAMVITKLDEALLWSMKRKLDREARNVEGTSQA